MTRVFSGIQPTGELHLGNFLGAIRNWARMQHDTDAIFCIVDLHAVTVPKERGEVGASTLRLFQLLMAAGLDPDGLRRPRSPTAASRGAHAARWPWLGLAGLDGSGVCSHP